MGLMEASMVQQREDVSNLFSSIGFGGYSTEQQLLLALALIVSLVAIPAVIAIARGAGWPITMAVIRDILIGILCGMSILGFLLFFYFVPKGIWTSLFGRAPKTYGKRVTSG